ncbi:MAG: hypothetical protein F4145_08265 [Boseongicola sp. SB0675_bin_26]|nr:hypothetical protein [Boseongicola sp. SB0675_bin_26]
MTLTGFSINRFYASAQENSWRRIPAKVFLREVDQRSDSGVEELLGLSGSKGVLRRSEMGQRASTASSYVGYRRVEVGQLISNKMQAWNGMFGISAHQGITSPDYAVYEFIGDTESRFVEYTVRTKLYSAEFHCRSKSMGTGFLRLNPAEFLSTPFWFPELDTQKAIADFLDRETVRIDRLIEKKLALVSLLWERQEASARSLLSGEKCFAQQRVSTLAPWLQAIPNHWEVMPLRRLVRISTGGRDTQDRTDDGTYPFYVRSMTVERIGTYSYNEEAVLTSGDGAGVGKVFHHVYDKFELHQRMYAFTRFKDISGRYFYHFLKTFFRLQMTQWSAKSTVDSVRMPFLKSMLFAVPPRHEQETLLVQIDAILDRTTRVVNDLEQSIERLREFRAALITAAVTGQIDVTAWRKQGRTERHLDQIEKEMPA